MLYIPLRRRTALTQRRAAIGHVFIIGETLCTNDWLSATLDEHGYDVSRCRDLSNAARASIAAGTLILLDGSPAGRVGSLALLQGLSSNGRRRALLVGWSLDARLIRQFIDAGVGDFLNMPASANELLLRLELRSRMAVRPPDTHLPRAEPLTGVVGSPFLGVRLSERELLLYQLFVERFGQPISREEILRTVWQRDESAIATSNVVDVYVRYLRVKLARAAPHLAIVAIRNFGYSLRAARSVTDSPPPAG